MGFDIMIEIEAGGTSSKVSQFDEDGKLGRFPRPQPAALHAPLVASRPAPLCRGPMRRRRSSPCPSGFLRSGLSPRAFLVQAHNVDAYFGDARRVAWWVEHADLGRLTVGRWESAGVLGTIDITGQIFLPASARLRAERHRSRRLGYAS